VCTQPKIGGLSFVKLRQAQPPGTCAERGSAAAFLFLCLPSARRTTHPGRGLPGGQVRSVWASAFKQLVQKVTRCSALELRGWQAKYSLLATPTEPNVCWLLAVWLSLGAPRRCVMYKDPILYSKLRVVVQPWAVFTLVPLLLWVLLVQCGSPSTAVRL